MEKREPYLDLCTELDIDYGTLLSIQIAVLEELDGCWQHTAKYGQLVSTGMLFRKCSAKVPNSKEVLVALGFYISKFSDRHYTEEGRRINKFIRKLLEGRRESYQLYASTTLPV